MEYQRWISEKIASKRKTRGDVKGTCRNVNSERRKKVNPILANIVRTANKAKKIEYARVQQMFIKTNFTSLGVQFAMSGDHEKHSVPPADEALLKYWEKVFIQKSKSDCRL